MKTFVARRPDIPLMHIHMWSQQASNALNSAQTAKSYKKWAWPPIRKTLYPKRQPRATQFLGPHNAKEYFTPTPIYMGSVSEVNFGLGRTLSKILTEECFS
jgi:hypothetical protein